MNIWFTSDEHYDHKNIIEYSARPFRDVEEMQREIRERHNSVVQPGDVVYHLGDFCFDERRVAEFLEPLNGRHRLVAGNHDKCHPCHKKYAKYIEYYISCGFEAVSHLVYFVSSNILLSHMPYLSDGVKEERYVQHRPKNEGGWLLHGHVHEQWKVKDRMINVGVDQWDFTPVSEETIMDIVNA